MVFSKIFLLCLISGVVFGEDEKICKSLHDNLKNNRISDVLISMRDTREYLKDIDNKSFKSNGDMVTAMKESMQSNSVKSQGPLTNFLSTRSVEYESFWINNEIHVPLASSALVRQMANIQNVQGIRMNSRVPLADPIPIDNEASVKQQSNNTWPAWGIGRVRANETWATTRGAGVVVGVIDSGVRATHVSLRDNFIGVDNFGWYDPYTKSRDVVDQNGHGTHCTGTILGKNNIGVAPDAKFIACRGCSSSSCGQAELLACGQFMLCPHEATDPNGRSDCSKHPSVVSNSWGGFGLLGGTWFNKVIDAWVKAGIVPVFAMGNSGPVCRSGGYPGVNPNVIGVGATQENERIAYFSSKGPHGIRELKPEISAPGDDVYSSSNSTDTDYKSLSGTSMAAPHVSGVIALMKSVNPNLTVDQVKKILYSTTVKRTLRSSLSFCGGTPDTTFPNFSFGHGRLDARNATEAAIAMK